MLKKQEIVHPIALCRQYEIQGINNCTAHIQAYAKKIQKPCPEVGQKLRVVCGRTLRKIFVHKLQPTMVFISSVFYWQISLAIPVILYQIKGKTIVLKYEMKIDELIGHRNHREKKTTDYFNEMGADWFAQIRLMVEKVYLARIPNVFLFSFFQCLYFST